MQPLKHQQQRRAINRGARTQRGSGPILGSLWILLYSEPSAMGSSSSHNFALHPLHDWRKAFMWIMLHSQMHLFGLSSKLERNRIHRNTLQTMKRAENHRTGQSQSASSASCGRLKHKGDKRKSGKEASNATEKHRIEQWLWSKPLGRNIKTEMKASLTCDPLSIVPASKSGRTEVRRFEQLGNQKGRSADTEAEEKTKERAKQKTQRKEAISQGRTSQGGKEMGYVLILTPPRFFFLIILCWSERICLIVPFHLRFRRVLVLSSASSQFLLFRQLSLTPLLASSSSRFPAPWKNTYRHPGFQRVLVLLLIAEQVSCWNGRAPSSPSSFPTSKFVMLLVLPLSPSPLTSWFSDPPICSQDFSESLRPSSSLHGCGGSEWRSWFLSCFCTFAFPCPSPSPPLFQLFLLVISSRSFLIQILLLQWFSSTTKHCTNSTPTCS